MNLLKSNDDVILIAIFVLFFKVRLHVSFDGYSAGIGKF